MKGGASAAATCLRVSDGRHWVRRNLSNVWLAAGVALGKSFSTEGEAEQIAGPSIRLEACQSSRSEDNQKGAKREISISSIWPDEQKQQHQK